MTNFCAVIPAFDAEATLGPVVRGTLARAPRVIVVDDGSSDGTARVATEEGAELLAHPTNLGKGCALRTAFHALIDDASLDGVVTLDADGQHLPEEIGVLCEEAAKGADLVLGSRAHLFAEMSRVRRTSNTLSSRMISLAAGQRLPDVQTGFRFYSRGLVRAELLREARFDAESAVVVRAVRRGFRVVCRPVRMAEPDGRATSHYRPVVDSLRIARSVVRARLEGAR